MERQYNIANTPEMEAGRPAVLRRVTILRCTHCGRDFDPSARTDDGKPFLNTCEYLGLPPVYPVGLMFQDGIVGVTEGRYKGNHLVGVEITFAVAANYTRGHGNAASLWAVRHNGAGNSLDGERCGSGSVTLWGKDKIPDWHACDIRRPHFLEMCEYLLRVQPDAPLLYYAGGGVVAEYPKVEALGNIERYKDWRWWGPAGTERMKAEGKLGIPEGGWDWLELTPEK